MKRARFLSAHNVLGTQNLLSASMQHGVKRFVHISTDEVYGFFLGRPGRSPTTRRSNPTNPYAASKGGLGSDVSGLSQDPQC